MNDEVVVYDPPIDIDRWLFWCATDHVFDHPIVRKEDET